MQSVMIGDHTRKLNIFFLPKIDLPSSEKNCILLIASQEELLPCAPLTFTANQGYWYGFTPALTFNQWLR